MHINELVNLPTPDEQLYVVSPKGTFGSGKSSIPHMFKTYETDPVSLYWPEEFPASRNGLTPVGVYLPSMNIVIIGEYKTQCGGCDLFNKWQIMLLLEKLWETGCSIVYEGILVSHTKSTYSEVHQELNEKYPHRKRISLWPFLYVHPLESVRRVIGRGSKRSADGRGVKLLKILEKHNSITAWFQYYSELEDSRAVWIDTHLGLEYVFEKVALLLGMEIQ